MTDEQITRMMQIVHEIEIDFCKFDKLTLTAGDVGNMRPGTVVVEASVEDDKGLIFEEMITLEDLRNGTIECDTLYLTDGRELRFHKSMVIPWEEFDTCES